MDSVSKEMVMQVLSHRWVTTIQQALHKATN
jgi:hypothetical protein